MGFLDQPLSLISIKPLRKIGDIDAYVTISENTNDTLTITKQPVQQGASITDHSYKEPTQFSTVAYFKAGFFQSLSKIYQELLDLQSSREPFDIVTPKRIYRSMLLKVLSQNTDKSTENILSVNMTFEEIIIVKVSTTQVPRLKQKLPGITGKTENAGKKSALLSLKEGIGALLQ